MKKGVTPNKRPEVQLYKLDVTSQCPLVGCCFDECYCKNMNSQKIVNVVHYCMRNYKACEIYKAKMGVKELTGLQRVDFGKLVVD